MAGKRMYGRDIDRKVYGYWLRKKKGPAGSQGDLGNAGPQGPIGPLGPVGPAGLPTITSVSTPTRALNTPFQPHATKTTWVSYTIRTSCTVSLGGSVTGTVQLRSDASATPTTQRASTGLTHSLGLGVGVASTVTVDQQISYIVPPAHYVNLVSSGAGTITVLQQTETVL